MITPYYEDENAVLFQGDNLEIMGEMEEESVDLIFADPPYFLSNDGFSCSGGKQVSVNKGEWDRDAGIEERHAFNRAWLAACRRVLTLNGTIFISGTYHNIYSIGMALEQEGYKILNNITWEKRNPPPNLSCRYFVHSTETILWARKDEKKAKHYFNYDLMREINDGKQMKDVWTGALTQQREKKFGKHPTQKPEYLLERIILAASQEGDVVLDPFVGSGTTSVVAKKLHRRSIGIDLESEFLDIAVRRLEAVNNEPTLF